MSSSPVRAVERQVVEAGAAAVVAVGGEAGRLLDDHVTLAAPPAAAVHPALVREVAEPLQQPAPTALRTREVGTHSSMWCTRPVRSSSYSATRNQPVRARLPAHADVIRSPPAHG